MLLYNDKLMRLA